MILKDFHKQATPIAAQEADTYGKFFHLLLRPGVYGGVTVGLLVKSTVQVIANTLDPGDEIVSALARMDAWYANTINFSTAHLGGPVPDGNYDIYVDAMAVDTGGEVMVYQAFLRYAEEGTLDESIYLILGNVTWASPTLTLNTLHACQDDYGVFDLMTHGRGVAVDVDLSGASRGLILADDMEMPAGSVLTLGAGAAVNVSGAGCVIDVTGAGSEVDIDDGTFLNIKSGGELDVKVGGKIEVHGSQLWESGSVNAVKSGAYFSFNDGSIVKIGDGDYTRTPEVQEIIPQNIPKAVAIINHGSPPTLFWSTNITSVTNPSTGKYTITLKRGFNSANEWAGLVTKRGTFGLYGVCDITGTNTADVYLLDDTATLVDGDFTVVFFGGDQA